jgi:BASS family bile acid:Na+ symporter
MALRDILANNVLIMVLAFITGFAVGGFPALNSELAMVSLVVVMSLSLGGLSLKGLDPRKHVRPTAIALLLSFGVSSGVTILLGQFFEGQIRIGWILLAAVPSAVAVIPFTYMLKGDMQLSLMSSTMLYILALALTPLITLVSIGTAISPVTLLWYVAVLIFLPMILSRGLKRIPLSGNSRTILINMSFFVLTFAVTGANRDAFLGDVALVTALLFVAVIRTFFVGGVVEILARRFKVDREARIPMVLFATYKNTGMAAALAVALIGSEAAIPATICIALEIVWFLALTKVFYPELQSTKVAATAVKSKT